MKFSIPMRGNERYARLLQPRWIVFSIPMRGNESETEYGLIQMVPGFSIPMRGNERHQQGNPEPNPFLFSIPMKGNEDLVVYTVARSRVAVFDPHEG